MFQNLVHRPRRLRKRHKYWKPGTDFYDNTSSDSQSVTESLSSTENHGLEPYDIFRHNVLALTKILWALPNIRVVRQRGSEKDRVVLIGPAEANHFDPCATLRVPYHSNIAKGSTTPRAIDQNVRDSVSIYEYLRKHHPKTAPCTLAYDLTTDNPLKKPYLLLDTASGQRLLDIYRSMPVPETRCFVDAVVDFMLELEQDTDVKIGLLSMLPKSPIPSSWSSFSAHPPVEADVGIIGFVLQDEHFSKQVGPTSTLSGYLEVHLRSWRRRDIKNRKRYRIELWDKLLWILADMRAFGFFARVRDQVSSICLHHPDFRPHNIIVYEPRLRCSKYGISRARYRRYIISQVPDWTGVRYVPSILTRRPPFWLWSHLIDPESEGKTSFRYWVDRKLSSYDDYVDETFNGRESGQAAGIQQSVKDDFEETLVEKLRDEYPSYTLEIYQDEAYGSGRWLRRLEGFALRGFCDRDDVERCHRFVADWEAELPRLREARRRARLDCIDSQLLQDEDYSTQSDEMSTSEDKDTASEQSDRSETMDADRSEESEGGGGDDSDEDEMSEATDEEDVDMDEDSAASDFADAELARWCWEYVDGTPRWADRSS